MSMNQWSMIVNELLNCCDENQRTDIDRTLNILKHNLMQRANSLHKNLVNVPSYVYSKQQDRNGSRIYENDIRNETTLNSGACKRSTKTFEI